MTGHEETFKYPTCDTCGCVMGVPGTCTECKEREPSLPVCGVADCTGIHEPTPPTRGSLCPRVMQAATVISHQIWGEPYIQGRGPMHYAGGTYWRDELRRKADHWERMAKAARICAEVMPNE